MVRVELMELMIALLVGTSSLYALLSLFRRLLPTSVASGERKLRNVGLLSHQSTSGDVVAVGASSAMSLQDFAVNRRSAGRKSLSKRLRYGAWPISPLVFYLMMVSLSLGVVTLVSTFADRFVLPFALLSGPLVMNGLLNRRIERRVRLFSADYAQFLMTVVSLLKTGMTPSGALEEAARGLPPNALVRAEVLLMIERIRVGMSEERSIGAFGEDIDHPEIELFVQSLLLGLRVGGSLADSLERLSKQVRKRQHFKSSSVASVAQQRGSMIAIVLIMGALVAFLSLAMPKLLLGLLSDPLGWAVVQACAIALMLAVLWLQSITRIKI